MQRIRLPGRDPPIHVGAKVAELVDALDLGSSGATREGSSPSFRTSFTVVRLFGDATDGLRWFACSATPPVV
jgi:hypothetical protein